MFPFSKIGPIDRAEKKALLFAFLACALFVVLFGVSVPVRRTRTRPLTIVSTKPLTKPAEPSPRPYADKLEKFRVKTENFYGVDFWNFSYGIYNVSNGRPVNLTLTDGETWDDSGWFNVQDVYYKDITGDGSPEAIVRLLHLRCNGSCDGGADLFYIYSGRHGKLKNIWRYETGSFAYGCSLKSFTLGHKQMVLELFGECAKQAMDYPGPAKYMVDDLTFILFEFDGRGFKRKTIEYITEPTRNVKNWEPEIRIY